MHINVFRRECERKGGNERGRKRDERREVVCVCVKEREGERREWDESMTFY